MDHILGVLMRWLHLGSVAILLGSVLYARVAGADYSPKFRPWSLGAMLALLVSGAYNLLARHGLPPVYHMLFGVKMLFAMHIFAVQFLLSKGAGDPAKRRRWMTGLAVSGFLAVLLGAILKVTL